MPIQTKFFGVHVLKFSGLGPEDSGWIKWDKAEIDEHTLIQLLRFDLDPDTLKPLDLKTHHAVPQHPDLFP